MSGQPKVGSCTSRSSWWQASEPPSSEDLDPYLRSNARPGTTPWFAKSLFCASFLLFGVVVWPGPRASLAQPQIAQLRDLHDEIPTREEHWSHDPEGSYATGR
jgi:hypothetical protein